MCFRWVCVLSFSWKLMMNKEDLFSVWAVLVKFSKREIVLELRKAGVWIPQYQPAALKSIFIDFELFFLHILFTYHPSKMYQYPYLLVGGYSVNTFWINNKHSNFW